MKSAAQTSTITGPVGKAGADADRAAPTKADRPPIAPLIASSKLVRSVQKRAATVGMMSRATIRTKPTILRPITVTRVTRPMTRRSVRRTSMPVAAANSASKATRVMGRRRATTSRVVNAPPPAISTASAKSIPAVEPRRKLSSPAARPVDRDWMTVSRTMPKPKNTDKTAPIAASSANRVRRTSHSIASNPTRADRREPRSRPNRLLPSPPIATIRRKARPIPGKVAWATASDTRARRRRNRNVPATPADTPSKAAPIATRAAL